MSTSFVSNVTKLVCCTQLLDIKMFARCTTSANSSVQAESAADEFAADGMSCKHPDIQCGVLQCCYCVWLKHPASNSNTMLV